MSQQTIDNLIISAHVGAGSHRLWNGRPVPYNVFVKINHMLGQSVYKTTNIKC